MTDRHETEVRRYQDWDNATAAPTFALTCSCGQNFPTRLNRYEAEDDEVVHHAATLTSI